MRYLVTGGAGFIGSHLVERLLGDGHEVVVLDNLSTGTLAHLEAARLKPGFQFITGDVADGTLMAEVVGQVDAVAHLAGTVGVARVLGEPSQMLMTGLTGTVSVLSAAARHGTPTLLTSSSEVYGTNATMPLHEDADLVLGSPFITRWSYAGLKAVAEMLAQSLHRDDALPTIVVRLFNTVGPRQRASSGMVVPRFVEQALQDRAVTVFGDGRQTRCFSHVDDVVDALVRLIHHTGAYGDVFNVGGTNEVRIGDLAELVVRRADSASPIRRVPYEDVFGRGFRDPQRRVPDVSKVSRLLGWRPARSLTDIIDSVIADARPGRRSTTPGERPSDGAP